MKFLLDTHVLLWATSIPEKRTPELLALLEAPRTELFFSAVSIWEVAIKNQHHSGNLFSADTLRSRLLEVGCIELPVTSTHAVAIRNLPPIHKDPFDRLLIAQAQVEGVTLLTADRTIARYPGPIRLLGRR